MRGAYIESLPLFLFITLFGISFFGYLSVGISHMIAHALYRKYNWSIDTGMHFNIILFLFLFILFCTIILSFALNGPSLGIF